jgi:hypothetical protein
MAYIKLGNNDLGKVAIGNQILGGTKEFPAIFRIGEGGGEELPSITLYDNSITPTGEIYQVDACNAYPSGNSHTLYLQKGEGNFFTTPQQGDTLYTDPQGTNVLNITTLYFGAYNQDTEASYYIKLDTLSPGQVQRVGSCVLSSTLFFDNSPTPTGVATQVDACNAISTGTSHTIYYAQANPGPVPSPGDFVYLDVDGTQPLNAPGLWFGKIIFGTNYGYQLGGDSGNEIVATIVCS